MLARHALPASSPEPRPAHADLSCTLPALSFQRVTTVNFSNPCVLITIQKAGGGWDAPRPFSFFDFPSSSFPYILPSSVSSNVFFFKLFQKLPGYGGIVPILVLPERRGELTSQPGQHKQPSFVFNHLRTAQFQAFCFQNVATAGWMGS